MADGPELETVTIETIGHRGDGIASGAGGPVYVPFTLPGERVTIARRDGRGRIVELVEASPRRVAPICRHFGVCGNCALQMMPLADTRALKRDFVQSALLQQHLPAEISETAGMPVASRRRTVLTALRSGRTVTLGYNERLTNRVFDVAECPVLERELAARLPAIRSIVAPLTPVKKPVRVTALLTRGGVDLDLAGAQRPSAAQVTTLIRQAQEAGIVRIAFDGEAAVTLGEATVVVGGVPTVPPPASFLQASAQAEACMTRLVLEHLAGCRQVADLFCGVGTFALALARQASVQAVEAHPAALAALAAALRGAEGLKRVTAERRDLFRFPLSPAELNRFDGVVFDPPRVGAKAQAEMLGASRVRLVAAISCNPASFARDARILVDGGLRLQRVVPVDQFVYSAETEVVGLFTRT